MEVTFFVGADAFQLLCPDIGNTETEFLKAFDAARQRIDEVAEKVYGRGGKGTYSYILTAEDF